MEEVFSWVYSFWKSYCGVLHGAGEQAREKLLEEWSSKINLHKLEPLNKLKKQGISLRNRGWLRNAAEWPNNEMIDQWSILIQEIVSDTNQHSFSFLSKIYPNKLISTCSQKYFGNDNIRNISWLTEMDCVEMGICEANRWDSIWGLNKIAYRHYYEWNIYLWALTLSLACKESPP